MGASATAQAWMAGGGKIACILTDGNIDTKTLVTILEGGVPARELLVAFIKSCVETP